MASAVAVQVLIDSDYQEGSRAIRNIVEKLMPEGMPAETLVGLARQIEKHTLASWDREKWQKEYADLLRQCDVHAIKRNELTALLRDLVDPNPCRYDHNGLCQEHSLHDRPCPHERAKRSLEAEQHSS